MNPNHGLTNKLVARLNGVLSRFPEVERAVLFGSRAKGTYRPGSDIDLALGGRELDWRVIGKIYEELDDLLLPYRFSLINFNRSTDPEVAAHIVRVGIPLFQRERSNGALVNK